MDPLLLATTLGSWNYLRAGHFSFRRLAPFLVGSMPCAWWGGSFSLSPRLFYALLLLTLLGVLIRLLVSVWKPEKAPAIKAVSAKATWVVGILIGAVLGFVAGAVGIGGGIYLVPIIRLLGRGTAKQAAACGAVFIWINSALGLTSRLLSQQWPANLTTPLLVLIPTVLLGSWLGSHHGARRWSLRGVEASLCGVLALASVLLLRKIILLS